MADMEQPLPASADPAGEPMAAPARRSRLLPMIIGGAILMQMLDGTVIANALPTMARSFGEDPVRLNQAITAYLLAAAVFLPISSWLADRFGTRQIFRIAIGGFAFASLLCGLSQNLTMLVLARLLQGMAGAMIVPVGRLALVKSVPKSELLGAMAWVTLPALLGSVMGPPLGGLIVDLLSWHWIFLINLPIGLLGVILASRHMPDIREENVGPLDLRGFLLSGVGLAGLVYGLENVGRGVMPPLLVAALLLGGLGCILLYVAHARRTADPILDLSLFGLRTYFVSTVGGLFSRMLIAATPFLMALLLQVGFGLSALQAGLLTFAEALGALVMKGAIGRILSRIGYRTALIVNSALVSIAAASYMSITGTTPHWLIFVLLFAGGFFRSFQFTVLNTMAFADVPPARISRASSLSVMIQQLSQSIGIGLAALLVHHMMVGNGHAAITAEDVRPVLGIIGALSGAGLFFFLWLPRDAGAELSGRRAG